MDPGRQSSSEATCGNGVQYSPKSLRGSTHGFTFYTQSTHARWFKGVLRSPCIDCGVDYNQ